MHGTEKSDLPILPKKRANKAVKAVAEFVEGRGGNKRNAERQSTARTQSRQAVSQSQDRIREAVTKIRGEKLTALLHHISADCLRWSYFELKKTAATGVDGVNTSSCTPGHSSIPCFANIIQWIILGYECHNRRAS